MSHREKASDCCFNDSVKIVLKLIKKSAILSINENVLVNIGKEQMQNNEKLLGIKIDSKLDFKDKIGRMCTKSHCQINTV